MVGIQSYPLINQKALAQNKWPQNGWLVLNSSPVLERLWRSWATEWRKARGRKHRNRNWLAILRGTEILRGWICFRNEGIGISIYFMDFTMLVFVKKKVMMYDDMTNDIVSEKTMFRRWGPDYVSVIGSQPPLFPYRGPSIHPIVGVYVPDTIHVWYIYIYLYTYMKTIKINQ